MSLEQFEKAREFLQRALQALPKKQREFILSSNTNLSLLRDVIGTVLLIIKIEDSLG
jgi:hypothetical protein